MSPEFLKQVAEERTKYEAETAELRSRIEKLERYFDELKKESESKKNRKFQTRCIQIAKEILKEEPIIEYRPPFLNGLELDAFFQNIELHWRCKGLSIGFIALAGIRMSGHC